ncbi:glycosyltransferase family 4 protein [Polynucleobacter paneuropaeus]|nr:glycosyltransferase family 4 protein [Polynucleobacter paneuropaeus]QWD20104.1 glycosyltransferase family 4 protein [Polynucleobacter paneuropaeus]
MKIGIFLSCYEPTSGGGYTFESDLFEVLLQKISQQAHQFCILVPEKYFDESLLNFLPREIEVIKVKAHPFFGRLFAMLESESSIFRAHWNRCSAIDRAARSAGVEFIWFLAAGNHRTDIPYLTVVWDLQHRVSPWFPEFSENGLWDRRELSHKVFLQRASAIIVGTKIGRDELKNYYQIDEDRILILPHPTPRFALNPQLECDGRNACLEEIENYILYPAQFWPHKNHINLLKALLICHQNGVKISLVLVGSDKGNKNYIEKIAGNLGIQEYVKFLGFVSRDRLVALYKNAIALVYTSFCGPENLPPLEAFAIGCPVIASKIPGSKEQLGDAALFFDPTSPKEIAIQIKALMSNHGMRERMISLGKERAIGWTAQDYFDEAVSYFDRFEVIRRCWH